MNLIGCLDFSGIYVEFKILMIKNLNLLLWKFEMKIWIGFGYFVYGVNDLIELKDKCLFLFVYSKDR